jgi:hypothetical protein
LLSHQRKKKKKRVWRQLCECVSECEAHLPSAVSLLLLEALFMLISGVSLTLTWPLRLCLLRVLLGATSTVTSFPLSKHTGVGGATHAFSGCVQFSWEMALPPFPVEFSSHCHFYKLSCSKVAGWVPPLLPSPARLFIYSSMRDSPLLRHSGLPALFATYHFCCCCLLFSLGFFSLFSLSAGQSVQGAVLIWLRVVCGSTVCHFSSPCGVCLPKRSGSWRLVAREPSWFLCFNMYWGCYVQARDMEESKFCLFWRVFPVRCISRVSPRFYFRKHTFCFLPLVAIFHPIFS